MNRAGFKKICSSKSVLIVDDDVNTQRVMKVLFSRYFRKVFVAGDGEEGMLVYKNVRPDLVISDITMPKKSGIEMVQELRQEDRELKVIFISGHTEPKYVDAVVSHNAKYCSKPVIFENVIEAVTSLYQ